MLKKISLLCLLYFTAAYCIAADDFDSFQVKALPLKANYQADKITENVFVIHGPATLPTPENQGFMNNPGFIKTSAGIVVIDPGSSVQSGEMVLEAIKKHSQDAVVAVLNTHIHGDHWLGNQAFKEAYPDVKIYAHPNMIARAESDGQAWITQLMRLSEGAIEGTQIVAPTLPLENKAEIVIGKTHFRAYHNGKAHTNTDIVIEVVEESVVFLGDNVFNQRIGRIEGGSYAGNIAIIDIAMELNAQHYVPGHGLSGDKSVPQAYRDFLSTLYTGVSKYYEEGLSDFQIKPKLLPSLKIWQEWSGFDIQLGKEISILYLEIEEASF